MGERGLSLFSSEHKDRGGADKILIARYRKNEDWNGLTIAQLSERTGKTPIDVSVEIEREGGASAVAFSMSEEDVRYVMKKPWVATASDGSSKRKDGSRSSSGLPADILGLEHRGYLRVGDHADVVLLDPDTFLDKATFADPHQYSTGLLWSWVNGQPTIREGKPTHALAGRPIRHVEGGKEQ